MGRPPKLTCHQVKEVLWRSGRQKNHEYQGKEDVADLLRQAEARLAGQIFVEVTAG
jgi:hypothetical protein